MENFHLPDITITCNNKCGSSVPMFKSRKYEKESEVCLPMRQLFTEDQLTHKLTTRGHRMASNNEQSPNHKGSYKRPRNDKC